MLPQYREATSQDPRTLFLFSNPKVGKTTALSGLPNALIIDTEDGSAFISGIKVNLRATLQKVTMRAIEANKSLSAKDQKEIPTAYTLLQALANEIRQENDQKKDFVYDFICIDTATGLEDMAEEYALLLYKETTLGKNFKGKSVLNLPNGAGYGYLREAFSQMYNLFKGLSRYALVITGHIKNSSITKDGKELSAKDVALTGKLKQIKCADMVAIGYIYRNRENTNQTMVSFVTSETDLATGARPPHLRGQEFILSSFDGKEITCYWDKIFTQLKKG